MPGSHSNLGPQSQSSWLILVIALVCGTQSKESLSDVEMLSAKPNRCTYARAYDMYGAHCGGLQLTRIPSLKPGIEILDFTENRLRELKADTFSSYSSIRFLYLAENAIFIIDENAFSPLYYLETLDLSRNAIMSVPSGLFQLPSLRNLYMSGNALIYLDRELQSLQRPIKAPLENLDLSDCRIDSLPNLGVLPQLRMYNASQNRLSSLPLARLAETCNLWKMDLSGSIDNIDLCELKPTIVWMDQNRIIFNLDNYARINTYEFGNCPAIVPETINTTYSACKARYIEGRNGRTSRQTWLTICGGLAGFLVGFILILYLMHRSNVAQTKRAIKKKSTTPSNNENYSKEILLNVK
ncbi:Leucine-rich repeat transmembrane neuronal protein 2 [Eumeta japonica]|uniref:Leucine-rich repeat transmembrane neuronal protein 2 n=1 Tax=Eumeta variegata TaxID=151549 RepID=A0A4C1UQA1_EUMVA|nr:Leucine-rich repeat transmembrane neuronal protein 2 [Eumeta japonica]